jgi:hypothetical protein
MKLEQTFGVALTLLFLTDIFLTVLYARAGAGLLAPRWNRLVWTLLRGVASLAGGRRSTVLALAGPLIVVSLIGFWSIGLTLGAALQFVLPTAQHRPIWSRRCWWRATACRLSVAATIRRIPQACAYFSL